MTTNAALSSFLLTLAKAMQELAESLMAADDMPLFADESPDPLAEHQLGKRQRQIVGLSGLAQVEGMKTAEIATSIAYELPNTYTALQALARQGVVEQVPDKEPQHWRLARRYRANSDTFMRIAELIQEGEWTTYGDISIAVLGHPRGARGVGRAAATMSGFPHPHRVLMEGGVINPNWHDGEGRGPEECQRRLEKEGVAFKEGVAEQARRVSWDMLMQRDALRHVS